MWIMDRRNHRVLENIVFVPVGHNPDAIWDHRHLSKAAVSRLRHGDNSQFLNGVGMEIGSFVDFMTKKCKWDENANAYQNEGRYRAEQFQTETYACKWDMKGIIHMLAMCSNHQRFSLMMLRKELRKMCAADQSTTSLTADGKYIDFVVGILAIQGHSRVKAPAHLFGWRRIDWRECPILFHQSDAANHNSIVNNRLYPGGISSYTGGNQGFHRWCVYASMADGHGHFPNTSMINGKLVKPYKHRRHGYIYCLSTYAITEVLGVEAWSTDADCAMIMGWVSTDAISYAYNCTNGECVHHDKARHIELVDQARDVMRIRHCAQFEREEAVRVAEAKRTADAVAHGQNVMPKQHHGQGPTTPKERLQPEEFASHMKPDDKQRWSMPNFTQGPRDPTAPKRSFDGDPDQCCRIPKWGHQEKLEKG